MLEEKSAKISGMRRRFLWLYIIAALAVILTATVVSIAFVSAFDAPEKDKGTVTDTETEDDTDDKTQNQGQNQNGNQQNNNQNGNQSQGGTQGGNQSGTTDNNQGGDQGGVVIPDGASVQWITAPALHDGTLIVVNKDNTCLPSNHLAATGKLQIVNVKENRTTGTKNLQVLDNSVMLSFGYVDALCKMADDLMASGITERNLMVYEGYQRDTDPTGDEKQTGLSATLRMIKDGKSYHLDGGDAESMAVNAWILANCHKYGIVLRYAPAKVPFTGVSANSRQFRYVGVVHATYMNQMNYCLEEYVEAVKAYNFNNRLDITVDEVNYSLYYVSASDAAQKGIPVPADSTYEISGDNTSGYIVLVQK